MFYKEELTSKNSEIEQWLVRWTHAPKIPVRFRVSRQSQSYPVLTHKVITLYHRMPLDR